MIVTPSYWPPRRSRISATQPPRGDPEERPFELSEGLRRRRDAFRRSQVLLKRKAQRQSAQSLDRGNQGSSDEIHLEDLLVRVAVRAVKEPVEILIGSNPSTETFIMDKQRLCKSSRYLNSLLQGDQKEAKEGKVMLKDVELATFELFAMFTTVPGGNPSTAQAMLFEFHTIAQLYAFGKRYLVTGLQDTMVDCFQIPLQVTPRLLRPHTVNYIQDHTGENSNLLQLLVYYTSMLIMNPTDRGKVEPPTKWFRDGWTRIENALYGPAMSSRPPLAKQWQNYMRGPCKFHVHDIGIACEQKLAYLQRVYVVFKKSRYWHEKVEAKRKRSRSESIALVHDARKRSHAQTSIAAGPDLSSAADTRLQTPPPEDPESDPADSFCGSDDEDVTEDEIRQLTQEDHAEIRRLADSGKY